MAMGVDESRDNRFSAEIDALRVRSCEAANILVGSDSDKSAARDGHCLGVGTRAVRSVDISVPENKVRFDRCSTRQRTGA